FMGTVRCREAHEGTSYSMNDRASLKETGLSALSLCPGDRYMFVPNSAPGTIHDESVTRISIAAQFVLRAALFSACRGAYPVAIREPAGGWTVSMLDALPDDGQRYEIIDGEQYVTPSPRVRHQLVVVALVAILVPYVNRACRAAVLLSPSDVRKGDRTSVQ